MRKNKVIYKLVVEDILTVADEVLERELTEEEIEKVINRVGDYIPWYDAIQHCFDELGIEPEDGE